MADWMYMDAYIWTWSTLEDPITTEGIFVLLYMHRPSLSYGNRELTLSGICLDSYFQDPSSTGHCTDYHCVVFYTCCLLTRRGQRIDLPPL